ncbi:hypothetical protein SAMN04488037_10548 [Shimia marina]|uniref:Uncharacterized protein n=1 Tax=Shimia marina TaxID=321267 RepID=A0A0P1EQ38_9RHOB|nr:hypothetical protein SHM7688_01726 [Shimia marina]SFE07479.1 hypothetical protein SAMN04488037_10548 [Shimia marina]
MLSLWRHGHILSEVDVGFSHKIKAPEMRAPFEKRCCEPLRDAVLIGTGDRDFDHLARLAVLDGADPFRCDLHDFTGDRLRLFLQTQ